MLSYRMRTLKHLTAQFAHESVEYTIKGTSIQYELLECAIKGQENQCNMSSESSNSEPIKLSKSSHTILCHKIKLYIQQSKLENFCISVVSNNKSFFSQNLKVVGPLGGNSNFFSQSGFEIQSDFDCRTSKIKFYSVRALKCYLNEKNLIHGRVTATISKFSP